MTSVYALHRDLSTSTAVDLTCTAHFTSPDDTNLILIKQNILELYTLITPSSPSSSPNLLLLLSLPLFGTVASLHSLRLPSYTRDSLLLSFQDCKLSLLHFAPATRELVTLDTATFEALRSLVTATSSPCLTATLPLVRVDPLHRCFSLLAYASTLLVFPLDSSPPPEPSPPSSPAPYLGPTGFLQPFPIPFTHPSLHPPSDPTAPLTSLIDFAFLSGYNSPTLLLLHHHPHTWEGRYAAHRYTAHLLTITLDLPSRTFLVLARTALTLPYDTHALFPLPAPHGGALVFSNHLTFHFSNQHVDYTLATNTYGDVDGKYHSEQSGVVVNLHLTAVSVLYDTATTIQLLLGTRDGQLLLMTVETAGTGVRLMQMRKLAVSASASAISTLERRGSSALVFIASRMGSSLLLELRERSEEEMRAEVREQERQEDERSREREQREKERQRLLRGEDEALQAMVDQAKAQADEEYDDIFGMSLSTDREREVQRREVRARAKEETSRQFELLVRDAMLGVAPCVDFVVSQDQSRPVELVGISGQGQQGAITLHTEGVVPLEITTFALDQRCTGCWTVRAQERRRRSAKRKRDEPAESFLPSFDTDVFISGELSTTHLHTAEEITQIEAASSYLRVDVPSLLIGNLCGYLGVVQVHATGIRLAWRGERITDRSVDQLLPTSLHDDDEMKGEERKEANNGVGGVTRIVRASLCDPYVALAFSDGQLAVLRVDEVERKEEKSDDAEPFSISLLPALLSALLPDALTSDSVTAMCIYRDTGNLGLFTPPSSPAAEAPSENGSSALSVKAEQGAAAMEETKAPAEEEEVDELEMLLGGGADAGGQGQSGAEMKDGTEGVKQDPNKPPTVESMYVFVVCRAHYLELYSLPSFALLFRTPRFTAGRKTLTNQSDAAAESHPPPPIADADLPQVTNVALHTFTSSPFLPPVLCAYTASHDVLIYQAFAFPTTAPLSSTALRFTRFQHSTLTRPVTTRTTRHSAASLPWVYGDRFIPFPSFSGHDCLLLTGFSPLLLFAHRGHLRLHPFLLHHPSNDDIDESDKDVERDASDPSLTSDERRLRFRYGLACATPFHNSQCERGCIFIDTAGVVHISELPPPAPLPVFAASAAAGAVVPALQSRDELSCVHYDLALPVVVHPLASTPRFFCFHPSTTSYALVLSHPKPIQSMEEPSPRSVTLTEDVYELLLLSSPHSPLPLSVIGRFDDFEPHEVVLCMATVPLNDRLFIAVGTATQLGEETSVKGRILLLDAYAAASSTAAVPLLKLRVFAQAEKGPVTCVAQVGNLLCVGVGMKLMLYEYDGKALVGRAFLDVQQCVVSVRVVKYYLLLADLYRTTVLAAWDPITKQIITLARHSDDTELTAVDFLLDQRHLTLVAADMNGNVQLMRWQPKMLPPPPPPPAQIHGGSTLPLSAFFAAVYSQKGLVVRADIRLPSAVTRMEKIRLRTKEARKGTGNVQLTSLQRGKSGTGGSGGGGAMTTALLPEAPMTARQHEQQQTQPFNLDVQAPALSTPIVVPAVTAPVRSALLMSTVHGQWCVLQPLEELVYRRLHSLTSQVHLTVPMTAALNARAFRSVSVRGGRQASKKNVVDGQLLRVYMGLPLDEQAVLARSIGMQVDHILDIIQQLEAQTLLR